MERTARIARLYPQLVAGMGRMRTLVHEGIDLTSNQYKTLLAVAGYGECSLGDLARTLEVAMSSASQMVDRLVSQQLLLREPAVDNRRQVVIRLSSQGVTLIAELQQATLLGYQKVLAQLPEKEQEDLVSAFETIAAILNKLSQDKEGRS